MDNSSSETKASSETLQDKTLQKKGEKHPDVIL